MSEELGVVEELERKTLVTLTGLVQKANDRLLTRREYLFALQALWDATSGLVSRRLMDMIEAAFKEEEKIGNSLVVNIRTKGNRLTVLAADYSKTTLEVLAIPDDAVVRKSIGCETDAELTEKFNLLSEKL